VTNQVSYFVSWSICVIQLHSAIGSKNFNSSVITTSALLNPSIITIASVISPSIFHYTVTILLHIALPNFSFALRGKVDFDVAT